MAAAQTAKDIRTSTSRKAKEVAPMVEMTLLFEKDGETFERPMFIRFDLGEKVSAKGNAYTFIGWDPERDSFSGKMSRENLDLFTKGQVLEGCIFPDGTVCREVKVTDYVNGNGNETHREAIDIVHDGKRWTLAIVRSSNGSGDTSGMIREPGSFKGREKLVKPLPAVASRWT